MSGTARFFRSWLVQAGFLAASLSLSAADLLRSGATPAVAGGAPNGATVPVAAGAQLRPTATDSLARTAQAIAAVQAMQVAARSLATSGANNLGRDPNHPGQTLPNVPDGLAPGGLVLDLSVLRQGADAPTQSAANGRTEVTVTQTAQQSLLTWQNFNVGKATTLRFDQSAGGDRVSEWIAFNQVNDPSGVPSQILGAIQAPGQVYVINQNGIIFGGSSQVNVHTLVASSLPVNDNLVARGLLNNPDQQFLFSSLSFGAGANGTPAFSPKPASTPTGASGEISVQAGARLSSPTTAEHVGGRIALLGPTVTNAGTLSAPDGQVILAAGQQVGFAAHDGNDPTLRGLDVFVGAGGGTVSNDAGGLIDAPRGAVTVVGRAIEQLGVVASTTSVAFNGRIDLLAEHDAVSSAGFAGLPAFFPQKTGPVTFGPGSVTQIVPELASTERVVGSQLALASKFNVRGQSVYLAPRSLLLAPSGDLTVEAGTWNLTGSGATAQDYFAFTGGHIYLDAGAAIDVSGSANVPASVSDNIVSVELRGAELANSPLLRDGPLRGQTVQIDLRQTGTYNGQPWVGTPLADTTGYVALVDHTVGQLTTRGGNVKLNAGGSVVLQPGSSVNVSGGWIDYAGGSVETTKVLADGRLLDISLATPDRVYDGLYLGGTTTSNAKWGVTETTSNPQLLPAFEPGYFQGGAGGNLSLSAPAMALDGMLLGATFAGPRQRSELPRAATLALAFQAQDATLPQNFFPHYSPTPPEITFRSGTSAAAVGAFSPAGFDLPESRKRSVTLSPDLIGAAAFGTLTITNSDGAVGVPEDTRLIAPAGGGIVFAAANVDVQGKLVAPGGNVSLTAYDRSPYADRALTGGALPAPPRADPSRGKVTLGAQAGINVSGLLIDGRSGSATPGEIPFATKGGTVAISGFSVDLRAGSRIEASGGVLVTATGRAEYGNGGAIAVRAGQDPGFTSLIGGSLALGGTMEAYSGAKGGALTLLAPAVQVGGTPAGSGILALSSDFFSQGGFSSFAIGGLGAPTAQADQFIPAVVIAPGTTLAPLSVSRIVTDSSAGVTLRDVVQPRGVRTPVSVAFTAPGVRDPFNSAKPILVRGDLVFGEGASLRLDPKAGAAFVGDTVQLLGSVSAPAGTIEVSAAKDSTLLFSSQTTALPTLQLGARSSLSTAGTMVLVPDARGIRSGSVLPGGKISVAGNVLAEAGAKLDVSGATGVLDLAPSYSQLNSALNTSTSGRLFLPTRVDSDGGVIVLAGAQELLSDATLLGAAGGPSALGGSLSVASGRFYAPGTGATAQTPADVTLTVTQAGPLLAVPARPAGTTAIGSPVFDARGAPLSGQGYFAADAFNRGGFDALALRGTVQFSGPVAITAGRSIVAGTSGIMSADAAVALNAPYVALGAAFPTPLLAQEQGPAFLVQGQPFYAPPVFGPGSLTVGAKLIDVGSLSLQGVGRAALTAENGDIRGNGALVIAGDLTLRAGQIYPPSAVEFTVVAFDYQRAGEKQTGSVTIAGSGSRPLPLSAGGTLNVYGSTLTQGGTLRAPVGTINLGWDGGGTAPRDVVSNLPAIATQQLTLGPGGVTSVSAVDPVTGAGLVIPFGVNLNGSAWIDPASNDITVGGVPGKAINLAAVRVVDQPGSTIDMRGGGDLFAYRWVPGIGGSRDILASSTSFAVVPSYQADYAPFAPYNPTRLNANLGGDAGYVNAGLSPGDRIFLAASEGLAAGTYTLLPARYALLPGAFLVIPQGTVPPTTATAQPDGSSVVAGYRVSELGGPRGTPPLATAYQVVPQTVVRQRAEYQESRANQTLREGAVAHDAPVPRLPIDAGQLVFSAARDLTLLGAVSAQAPTGGRGGLVDISSPADIVVAASRTATAPAGSLVLSAPELSAFGAESLLIGGVRVTTGEGTTVAVKTGNLTLDNAGAALRGTDLILASNRTLTLAPGALLDGTGAAAGTAERLVFGNVATAGSGDGALVRVSSDAAAEIARSGVTTTGAASLIVGAGARLGGGSVTLDSTRAASLDPTAVLSARTLSLDSGQITLQLANAGNVPAGGGLALSGAALQSLQAAGNLSLLSYSSIDIYGSGQVGAVDGAGRPTLGSLALHTAQIRGFNTGGGTVAFAAREMVLDNAAGGKALSAGETGGGALNFVTDTLRFGANRVAVDQFANVIFDARNGVLGQKAGDLVVQGALSFRAPVLTGATGSSHSISAGGALALEATSVGPLALVSGGLGAEVELSGATVAVNTNVALPSGGLALRATRGDLQVGNAAAARLDVSGTAQTFFDLTTTTSGGDISLLADAGSVNLGAGSVITVAAAPGGVGAGDLTVGAPAGSFAPLGSLLGAGGTFSLDVGSAGGSGLATINAALNRGGFEASRSLRVRTGDVTVDGPVTARVFDLSADRGSIVVAGSGFIDASGATGGTIALAASGGVTLQSGSRLTVAAKEFNAAGKGGAVVLETRGENGAVIDLQSGSTIDLSVAAANGESAARGRLTGVLQLRAPQTGDGSDVQIAPLNGTVRGASAIVTEGYRVFDLTTTGEATIDANTRSAIRSNSETFATNTAAISRRLIGGQPALGPLWHVRPGVEIVNRTGDLTLADAWDLSTWRFGPDAAEPGALTLRAAGNLNFDYSFNSVTRTARIGTLSDGFGGESPNGLWTAPLLAPGSQSWSYRLVAGADLGAADTRRVQVLAALGSATGSLLLGRNTPPLPIPSNPNSPNAASNLRETIIPNFFQTIRTGTGDIGIFAGRDIQILNPIATIYTAGTQAPAVANFDLPVLNESIRNSKLGQVQTPISPASYSFAGGNVMLVAQNDITHLVQGNAGLVADSSKELPTNWLYRRGYVDPATGRFAATRAGGDVASTSWWIDFSNFFEGVGALGGGEVALRAGRDIANVDAVVPTNARMPQGVPNLLALVELGGGDLTVRAGRDIDGGVYYVERGAGSLVAGGTILTNSTRAALKQSDVVALETRRAVADPTTWLPTTLFLGQGSFTVAARGDLLLGPVANAFLLPQGVNNSAYQKTYFSTYGPASSVDVRSLTGTLTLRDNPDGRSGSLANWYENVLLYDDARHQTFSSYSQPWLRLLETDITPFYPVAGLLPGTLRATAFSGDLNLVGGLTLSPSPSGALDLAAAKSVNGVQVNGVNTTTNSRVWGASQVNLSDADPRRIPGPASPLALAAAAAATPTVTPPDVLEAVNALFNESGSTVGLFGVVQTKQALHAAGPLHAGDPLPLHVYAKSGDVSGLTLFSGKASRIIAGRDISDISLYLQNTRPGDVSVVAAGRDLVAFNPNSPLRLGAQVEGNELIQSSVTTPGPGGGTPNAGDIQISGPGALEVTAGRNFDLGVGPTVGDGTAIGITSVGNARNPNLPFAGADIVAGAGLGAAAGLESGAMDFGQFERAFLDPATAGVNAARYLPIVATALNLGRTVDLQTWQQFTRLPSDQRRLVALEVFYRVLRDAGRDHGDPASPGYRNYGAGFAAIAALFPGSKWRGDFSLTSREIKTTSGGDIRMFAPGGQLTVGFDVAGSQPVDQGVLTESGGDITIFTHGSVVVGTSRIFTLRGGDEVIWSSTGNIAAGASSKTVQSAPPTRVLVDPQSGDVKTDLAGLATGGGIGVLATVAGVPPGDVDLVAPVGTIDAGDAGIRVSGNLNISALQVVNAANIQVSGASVGTPTVAAPALGGLLSATATTGASSSAAQELAKQTRAAAQSEAPPSLITVEVLGYGGSGEEPERGS